MDAVRDEKVYAFNKINFDQQVNKIGNDDKACYVPLRYIVSILALLAGSMVYITRVNLSVAIVAMSKFNKTKNHLNSSDVCESTEEISNTTETSDGEFEWNQTEQGVILGAFFYGYIFFQVIGGRLAEIFGAKWLAAGGVTMSIIINCLTPTIARAGYIPLIASRVVLGVCQAFVFPSLYALITKWLPDSERGTVLSFPTIGGNVGTIASSSLSGYLAKHGFSGGWPSIFYVSAIIAFVWLCFWSLFIRSTPDIHPMISDKELNIIHTNTMVTKVSNISAKKPRAVPWLRIFTSMPVLSTIIVKFTINWNYQLILLKLPSYLQTVLKYPVDKNGYISSMVYGALTISLLFGGFFADFLLRKKVINKTYLRKFFELIATIGTSLCLAIIPLVGCNNTSVIILFVASMIAFGMQAGGDLPIMADMTNEFCATVFAITNTVSFTCGFLTPLITGIIIEADPDHIKRQWSYVFYISAAINVFGAVMFTIFGSAEQQSWDKEENEHKHYNSLPYVTKL